MRIKAGRKDVDIGIDFVKKFDGAEVPITKWIVADMSGEQGFGVG